MAYNYITLWRSKYGAHGPGIHAGRILDVKRRIPPERLLIFNVKQGWAPLCEFLKEEVPSEPFPSNVWTLSPKTLPLQNAVD